MKLQKLDEILELAQENFSGWVQACDLVSEFFGGVGSAIIPVNKNARLPWLVHSKSLEKLVSIYIKDEWYLKDMREKGLVEARQKGFTTDLDFINETEMAKTPYYRDFLRPNGIGGFIAILFEVERKEWVISVQLPLGILEPKTEYLSLIPEIKEKLEVAAQASVDCIKLRIDQIISDSTMFHHGVVLLDANNNISLISGLAIRMFKCHSVKINNGNFLNKEIKEKVHQVLKAYEGGSLINEIHALARGEALDLFCKISTVPNSMRVFNSDAVSMILLVEVKSFYLRQDELLVVRYGLTKTEKMLALKLLDGMKLKEIAKLLNITEGNARQHLKKIFRKVDVSSQTELIVKIMRECTMIDS